MGAPTRFTLALAALAVPALACIEVPGRTFYDDTDAGSAPILTACGLPCTGPVACDDGTSGTASVRNGACVIESTAGSITFSCDGLAIAADPGGSVDGSWSFDGVRVHFVATGMTLSCAFGKPAPTPGADAGPGPGTCAACDPANPTSCLDPNALCLQDSCGYHYCTPPAIGGRCPTSYGAASDGTCVLDSTYCCGPACAPSGAGCGQSSDCCAGLACANGTCGTPPGPPPADAGPAPRPCQASAGPCSSTADCCTGLACASGSCAPPPADGGWPNTCVSANQYCASNADCCGKDCQRGICGCNSPGTHCTFGGDCCSGTCLTETTGTCQ